MELRFHLLGTVAITLGGQPITPMRSRSAEALLIYLALHKKRFSRQVLADFFWDDRSQERALSNLRTVLAMLRRQLPDHLHITRHTVSFNHDAPHWLDVTAFKSLNLQSPLSDLQSLISLYRADFLSGSSLPESRGFETWALVMREEMRQRAAAVLHDLLARLLRSGDYGSALPYARQLLQLNSLDDLAQRRLIELLWRSGQRNAALQQYAEARELMARELGVAPDPATTALYERLCQAPFPPSQQLPTPLTGFVGREEELAHIAALIDEPQARLVTILGPGGMGKTRLLLEAAHHIARTRPGRFIDGIIFVPLAGLAGAEFLLATLAQHLNLSLRGSDKLLEQLLAHLRTRELLLALAGAHCPGSTGRAPAPQLASSSGVAGRTAAGAAGADGGAASRLFINRAAAVCPSFAPDDAACRTINSLCRLVDGMPLALELAAAGARTLSCAEILEQVQLRLDWQFDHFPDRPRRHQNLEAVFEQSWALLTDEEQEVVRRFLAQKLQADRLLAQETARSHVDYIARLRILSSGGKNIESHYRELMELMERQCDQVIAAALWLARRREFAGRKLVTLIETLIFYHRQRSLFESWKVTIQQLLQALARGEGEEEQAAWLAAVLRSRLAEANFDLHRYDRAQDQFEALLPQAYMLENGALISFCHHKLAQIAGRRADFATANDHFAAALPPLKPTYGQQYYFPIYRSWTKVALLAADLEQARATAEKAYALALEVDSQLEAEPTYLWALGEISFAEGNLAQAREKLEQSLYLAREKGYWVDVVCATISLATVLAALGSDTAASLATTAYDLAHQHHDQRFMALAARAQGHAAVSLGDNSAASAYFQHSRTLLAAIGDHAELTRTPAGW